MNTIALVEKIAHVTTELIYAIACGICLVWQYRHFIGAMILIATLFILGLYGYCYRMETIY